MKRNLPFARCVARATAIVVSALGLSSLTPANAAAQSPLRISLEGGLAAPVGDLADASQLGFDLAARATLRAPSASWGVRANFTWDRFGGKGPVDSYSLFGAGLDLVHHPPHNSLYEFIGAGAYNDRVNYTTTSSVSDTRMGAQLGFGWDLTSGLPNTFVEAGLASVFTSGSNTMWIPVRFGVRF